MHVDSIDPLDSLLPSVSIALGISKATSLGEGKF